MYLPHDFTESRLAVLQQTLVAHPFGTLFSHGRQGLDANHFPFLLAADEGAQGVLRTHIARNNPLWHDVADGDPVLVVFHGGDAYVSPNWYPTKHETGQQVPTWNYVVVHVHGRIRFIDDEGYLRRVLAGMTHTFEATQPAPWQLEDAPQDYLNGLLQRTIGLEIEITRLEGKSKLGQDEVARDAKGAAEGLKACGQHAIGDAMLAALRDKPPAA